MFKVCIFVFTPFSLLMLGATKRYTQTFFFLCCKRFSFCFLTTGCCFMEVSVKVWWQSFGRPWKLPGWGYQKIFSLSSKTVFRKLIIRKLAVTIPKSSSMTIYKLVSTHIHLIHCALVLLLLLPLLLPLSTHTHTYTHTMLLTDCNLEHAFLFQYKWVCIFF